MCAYTLMEQIAFRVPEEHKEELQAYADENDVSLSDAGREYIRRGTEYEDIQSENERLRNRNETSMERYNDRREDEVGELVEYARMQREKDNVGRLTRWKWRWFGQPEPDDSENGDDDES